MIIEISPEYVELANKRLDEVSVWISMQEKGIKCGAERRLKDIQQLKAQCNLWEN